MKAWHEYETFTRNWLTQAVRVLKPTGSIYVFMGVRFIAKLFLMLENDFGLLFNGWITWHYTQGMGRKKGFSPRHEDILYFTRSKEFTFNLDDIRIPQKYYRERNNMAGANPGDVWQFSHVHYCSAERENHPTQKPEALMERIIRASSNPGDLVLDPFVGSGTTCKVAEVLQRNWIGIDINPEYIAMSQKRIGSASDQLDSMDVRIQRVPRDLPQDKSQQPTLLLE
jgi:site-specific DNA-methyltransferase (adenine-specific)